MMMMLQKPLAIFSCLCLVMAISSTAQSPPVLDTDGQPLRRGVEYYIKPAVTDVAGNLTLVTRKGDPCPFHVGQVPLRSKDIGRPVIFTPFQRRESTIREGRDLKVVFQAFTICITSTEWRVGETEPITGRRLVATGKDETATGFFRIDKSKLGVYNLGWCPSDFPIEGRPRCGSAGIFVEKGVRLLTLDGPAFSFEFVRA